MRENSKDYVKLYLKEYYPFKQEKDLTLLKVANRIIKKYDLKVKPATIMKHINNVLREEYNNSWDAIEYNNRQAVGVEGYIYLITCNSKEGYYYKIGSTTNWQRRESMYKTHNPCFKLIFLYHYKGVESLENIEFAIRLIFSYYVKGRMVQCTEWKEIDDDLVSLLSEEKIKKIFELIDMILNESFIFPNTENWLRKCIEKNCELIDKFNELNDTEVSLKNFINFEYNVANAFKGLISEEEKESL